VTAKKIERNLKITAALKTQRKLEQDSESKKVK
jgi:hypothetical protein